MSNERDRIEEEVAIHLRACFLNNTYEQARREWQGYHQAGKEAYLRQARQILNIRGLLIEADNQELPENYQQYLDNAPESVRREVETPSDLFIFYKGALEAQQDMLKDNFKRVIPKEG